MHEALFRAHHGDDLAFRVQDHAVFALIPIRAGKSQLVDALAYGVAVRLVLLRAFAKLVDYMLRRPAVGIAHRKIDYILAGSACSHFYGVNLGKNVIWQTLDF